MLASYERPPTMDITLDEFEVAAIDRLKRGFFGFASSTTR